MERTEPRNRIRQRRPPTAGARLAVVPKKLSRLHRPEGTSLEAWQTALRRQFGREQRFLLKNTGGHPISSEFEVTNPESQNIYRVAIRGSEPGNNFCSCPDFATNTLGTCKHIEFALARLGRNSENRKALARAFEPPFSEVYLHYGAQRQVRFRPRAGASAALTRLAAQYFDGGGTLRTDAFVQFETFLSAAARLDPDLRCYEDALDFVAQVRDAERREKVLAEVFPRGIRSAAFKNLLRVPLYDYQREAALFATRAGRCLIGDDMGWGKPSRPSRWPRSWPTTSASSACSSYVRPLSSISGSARSPASSTSTGSGPRSASCTITRSSMSSARSWAIATSTASARRWRRFSSAGGRRTSSTSSPSAWKSGSSSR